MSAAASSARPLPQPRPAGHALYEQGRNLAYDGLPVNAALGMGVHESQSLLWERMVGLSRPFAAFLLPLMREFFPQVKTMFWMGA